MAEYANDLGVDFSEGQDLTNGTLKTWWQSGVRRLYIQYSGKLAYYLDRVRDEDLESIDVYVYLYFPHDPWNQTPEVRVRNALRIIKTVGVPVRYVWLDLEDPNDRGTPDEIIDALLRCGDLIHEAGFYPGIYTGRSAYIERTGNSTAFSDRGWPLWHANYVHGQDPPSEPDMDQRPEDVDFGNVSPYGGWVRPLVRQWWGTTLFGSHSVDLNIERLDSTVEPDESGEEDDMKFILPEPGLAEFWSDRVFAADADEDPADSEMDAVKDLHAQPGDVARFICHLVDGEITFYHGETDLVAAVCEGTGRHEVEAKVSDAGKIRFEVVDDTEVAELYSVGNWR